MSQIQSFVSSMGPAGPILTLTGDLGGAVAPTLGNITIEGAGNTTYGFALLTSVASVENPVIGASAIQLIPLYDTVTTNDAVLTAFPLATFAIPVNKAVVMSGHVIGNRADVGFEYTAACGGYVVACARRGAGAAVLVEDMYETLSSEDGVGGTPQFSIQVVGNSIGIYVQGLAGQTWNWTCTFTYQTQLL